MRNAFQYKKLKIKFMIDRIVHCYTDLTKEAKRQRIDGRFSISQCKGNIFLINSQKPIIWI